MSTGRPPYAAQTWSHRRRVLIKAEVVRLPGRDPKCHPRCVGTKLTADPATGYAVSCQRGDMENRLKEWHDGLALDRTSGSRFWANQFRGLLTVAAAYGLLQALRQQAYGTACATAQISTRRERLPKLAVWVERLVRRMVLHLPRTAPWGATWHRVAVAVGATPG
jgi:Transposase DDE domain group 1